MKAIRSELLRYGVAGLASNGVGYLLYLGLTFAGLEPKLAMTLTYGLCMAQSFVLNQRWTFPHSARLGAIPRYALCHACAYVINWVLLYFFVNRMGVPHQLVQAIAILVVAAFLFLAFRHWAFKKVHAAIDDQARS